MKSHITLFSFLLLLSSLTTAQHFKPVSSAQDVIDNFLTAHGGAGKLKAINIVELSGKISFFGNEMKITKYVGRNFYYQSLKNGELEIITACNSKDNYGWESRNGRTFEFDEKALEYYNSKGINYWGVYLDSKMLRITYVLKGKDTINNEEVYVIDILKDLNPYSIYYFNSKSFERIKSESDGQELTYSDFKEVGNTGINMPHLIAGVDTLWVSQYKFNPKFDKSLLNIPDSNK